LSPDKRLLGVVGDANQSRIISADNGEVIAVLEGHLDHNFACAWSPNSILFATGGQDLTTRIYDIRNLSKSIHCLPTVMSSVRSLHFDPSGTFLAVAESADFVHIFDPSRFEDRQVVYFNFS
jgi:WD40 repeat protein